MRTTTADPATATATSSRSRRARALVAALALVSAAALAACGSSESTYEASGPPAPANPAAFAWVHPAPAPSGWRTQRPALRVTASPRLSPGLAADQDRSRHGDGGPQGRRADRRIPQHHPAGRGRDARQLGELQARPQPRGGRPGRGPDGLSDRLALPRRAGLLRQGRLHDVDPTPATPRSPASSGADGDDRDRRSRPSRRTGTASRPRSSGRSRASTPAPRLGRPQIRRRKMRKSVSDP